MQEYIAAALHVAPWVACGAIVAIFLHGFFRGIHVPVKVNLPWDDSPAPMVIAGGQESGLYYMTALKLRDEIRSRAYFLGVRGSAANLEVRATAGSTDNYRRLLQKEVDAAIIQEDYVKKYDTASRRIKIVQRLYRENFMLVCVDSDMATMTSHQEWAAALLRYRFQIPPAGMGARDTTESFLQCLKVPHLPEEYSSVSSALDALLSHSIDGFFMVSGEGDSRIEDARANPANPEIHIVVFPEFATNAALCVRADDDTRLKDAVRHLAASPHWISRLQSFDPLYAAPLATPSAE